MLIHTPNIWFFPSNYGDIRLERVDKKKTNLIYFKLTSTEVKAMQELRKASVGLRRRWATQDTWETIQKRDFQTGEATERLITLDGSITSIGNFLKKTLRPDRDTVTVVKVGDELREMRFSDEESDEEEKDKPDATVSTEAGDPEEGPANEEGEETALAKTGTDDASSKKPVKAATVKKPNRGCPAPTFEQIKLRATRVLRAFLSPQQVSDFNRRQRFVTVGADTGHRYMLTSRNAPDEIKNFGARCVFDLNENRSYCVHDYEIPAEEELLTLHCLLSLPGYEKWARAMPDDSPVGSGGGDIGALLAGV